MIAYQAVVLGLLLLFFFNVVRNLRDYAPLREAQSTARANERLAILIPARNEADNIGDCLAGLTSQTWREFTVLVLDDDSNDGTAEIVTEIAAQDERVSILRGQPIPVGWAGKVWACSQLAEAAQRQEADWLLFLDADTRARPELAATLLRHAQDTGAGMVSTFPYQVTGSFWEHVVLPMLHFLILTFLPIRMVWESNYVGLVAACGQVELFSAEAYRRTGGHASIQGSFHDGLQLARRVKASGMPVRLCDASALISCRMYTGGKAVWNGFTRNAYEGLGSVGALAVMTILQVWLFLTPFLFLAGGVWRGAHGSDWTSWTAVCAAQVALILSMRILQARRFGHPESVLLHPISIAALVAIQWASFWKTKRGAPVAWKGRAYGKGQQSG